jgi:hypothetical protein
MDEHKIIIEWAGPFEYQDVIDKMKDGGKYPEYDGNDYGLYQIYGKHILCGSDTLLYIGKAARETFSDRFKYHKKWWIADEEEIKVYLGRVYDPQKHSKSDKWKSWEHDIDLAERILIYKYSPNYNNASIGDKPSLLPFKKILLIHEGNKQKLGKEDNAPEDY